jgi:integrase
MRGTPISVAQPARIRLHDRGGDRRVDVVTGHGRKAHRHRGQLPNSLREAHHPRPGRSQAAEAERRGRRPVAHGQGQDAQRTYGPPAPLVPEQGGEVRPGAGRLKRNVVGLCEVPEGKEQRPSKALNLDQAEAILKAAGNTRMYAYVVLSLLIGARTEELRALAWSEVDLEGDFDNGTPPWIAVWRSVREGGDTKTKKSRRSLALPRRCVEALQEHRTQQANEREEAGAKWKENDLVFASLVGTPLDSHNVRRAFRKIVKDAGLPAKDWTPREMRHSFVSLLSDSGVPLEDIARLVGHSGTAVTEAVYRKQIRPVLLGGAEAMDRIFT